LPLKVHISMRSVVALSGMALVMAWADPAAAQTARASASVEIISPAVISTQLLLGPAPGVLKITVPGSLGSTTMDLTATGADAAAGICSFASSRGDAAAMTQLIAEASRAALAGSLSTRLVLNGLINGQAMQIVVLIAVQNADGSGSLKATITFD
jgi:hypothetical protein